MLQQFDMWITPLNRATTIHLHLPDDYYNSQERYPVVYMFDGQNLFVDDEATFGTCWGLEDFLRSYDKPFVVVGIECDHRGSQRLQEYTPYVLSQTFFSRTTGDGAKLMDWIVHELKPFIDKSYRTWPHREATGIAGSSMGGLMAMYAVCHYNEVFSKAACLSPSLMIAVDETIDEMTSNFIQADMRIYWSFGSKELSPSDRIRVQRMIQDLEEILEERGGRGHVLILEGARHNEQSWRRQNPLYFDFLWKD